MEGLVMDTVTPGMTAPLVSVTLPLMAPVVVLTVWPNVSATEPNASTRTRGVIRQRSRLMGLLRRSRTRDLTPPGRLSTVSGHYTGLRANANGFVKHLCRAPRRMQNFGRRVSLGARKQPSMPSRFQALATALLISLALAAGVRPQEVQTPPVRAAGADAGFVGATACASCHQRMHETWKSGRHSRMVQPASTASVIGDFSKGAVTLRGSRYRFRISEGQFFITESSLTGKEQEHRVEYTLGNRRIQHYLTTVEDGRIIVLPPSWDVGRRSWFHNMEIVRPDEDDKTHVQQWNKSCVGCH